MTSSTIADLSVVVRVAQVIDAAVERRFWLWGAILVVLLLACSIVKDVRSRMWTDELFTLYMAHQAGPGQIVQATIEGSDGAPPLYAMIVRSILPVVRNEALAVRLPATLGACGMVLFLLAFCRRRVPAVYSLFAALLAFDGCLYYSTEGRGYGLVLCGAAGALLCWQAAADGRRRPLVIALLAFCLALMTALHYCAIFFLVPLFLGEMMRWRTSGKLDFAILAAMAPALLVLGVHYPLITGSRHFQSHYWSPVEWTMIPQFYIAHFLPMLALCPFALVGLAIFPASAENRGAREARLPVHEWVVIGALALLPPLVIAVSKYTTHMFIDRYALWALIGLAVLVGAVLCAAARRQAAVGVMLLGSLALLVATHVILPLRNTPVLRVGEAIRRELETLPDGPEPIVIPRADAFMELSYYAEPRLRERITYPASPGLDLHYFGFEANPLLLSAVSHRTKLHVIDYDEFLAAHPRFVLAATHLDYLPWHLVAAGYRVVPIHPAIAPLLYEVQAPDTPGKTEAAGTAAAYAAGAR